MKGDGHTQKLRYGPVQSFRLSLDDLRQSSLIRISCKLRLQQVERPVIDASGFRISCAMPADITPMAAICSFWRICRSSTQLGQIVDTPDVAGRVLVVDHDRGDGKPQIDLLAVRALVSRFQIGIDPNAEPPGKLREWSCAGPRSRACP